MPRDTKQAIEWAVTLVEVIGNGEVNEHFLVHYVREYFNDNNIQYDAFSYKDLVLFLPQ